MCGTNVVLNMHSQGVSVVGGWLLLWRYRCYLFVAIPALRLVSTGTFRAQCCSRTRSIDMLACIEGKFGFEALARLTLGFGSTTLYTPWFSVSNNQQQSVFMYMEKASFWSGDAAWGIIISLGSTPSLYQMVDDDGFLEEYDHHAEARSFL
ncbi:predicted protein [Lichtheimia corymbifera JMRC:FSU:9682]|uniref:Uncharacterized protein n=1 Tax=Lichtheimia corymbifera JMRC:FSU:9682 TaxID=1263082 RepID=A0A068RT27_9FUNG|nr:predicted protein [Lichtheimia corymbifera JMRC:FSU:9682]